MVALQQLTKTVLSVHSALRNVAFRSVSLLIRNIFDSFCILDVLRIEVSINDAERY
jgi:hypothetical protein